MKTINTEDWMEHRELTERIIRAAIAVQQELGPGFLESIYESALCVELEADGLKFNRQMPLVVNYRGQLVGEHRLDLLVEGKIVVELKSAKAIENIHFSVVRSYLKAAGLEHGLLLNFATIPLEVRRVRREKFSPELNSISIKPSWKMARDHDAAI